MKYLFYLVIYSCFILISTEDVMAQQESLDCGDLENAYGPYDYSSDYDRKNRLNIVEIAHFTPKVENLIEGQSGALVKDIDYTLRAFPNHIRALRSMMSYQKTNPWTLGASFYPVECYFYRAQLFRPNDADVLGMYGVYLATIQQYRKAVEKFEAALELRPNSIDLQYNIGLALFSLKDYERSLVYAKKAYASGYPLLGLKKMLQEVGFEIQ